MGGAKGSGTRKLLSTKRLRGTVLDWFDKFGWIQATQEIDHPDAYRNQGRIYLLAEDVQEDLPGIGCAVTFFLYQDANGLGAMNVRPAAQIPGQQVAQGGKTFSGGKGGKAQPQSFAQQLPNPKRMKTGPYSGGYAPVQTGPVMPHEEVLQKVHSCLNKQVWKAIKKIAEKEKDWDEMELFKRITKYLYKGAQAPELLTMPWQQSAQQYIETAMRGYSTACADKPWFFDMDLTVAFHMSYWEILSGSGQNPQWSEVEAVLNAKYEELMDDCLLDKAIWDSAGLLLPDQEALRNKVYKGLKSAHERAREETLASPLRDDLQRVEFFYKVLDSQQYGKGLASHRAGWTYESWECGNAFPRTLGTIWRGASIFLCARSVEPEYWPTTSRLGVFTGSCWWVLLELEQRWHHWANLRWSQQASFRLQAPFPGTFRTGRGEPSPSCQPTWELVDPQSQRWQMQLSWEVVEWLMALMAWRKKKIRSAKHSWNKWQLQRWRQVKLQLCELMP